MTMRKFLFNDSGAVTVDWVTMTASVVGLGLASVGAVATGNSALGERIRTALAFTNVAGASVLQGGGFNPAGLTWWPGYAHTGGVEAHWYGYPGEIEGWVLADPTMRVDVMPSTRYGWLAAAMPGGGQVLELGGSPGEALDIRQGFEAAPGTALTFSFQAGAQSNGNGMRVWHGDTLLAEFPALPTQTLNTYSYTITAGDPSQNYLRFEATSTYGWDGPLITNVALR